VYVYVCVCLYYWVQRAHPTRLLLPAAAPKRERERGRGCHHHHRTHMGVRWCMTALRFSPTRRRTAHSGSRSHAHTERLPHTHTRMPLMMSRVPHYITATNTRAYESHTHAMGQDTARESAPLYSITCTRAYACVLIGYIMYYY
jgi:hypothetical protein